MRNIKGKRPRTSILTRGGTGMKAGLRDVFDSSGFCTFLRQRCLNWADLAGFHAQRTGSCRRLHSHWNESFSFHAAQTGQGGADDTC